MIEFECDTQSEANIRGRWGKMTRAKAQRDKTFDEVAIALANGQVMPTQGPWFVRLTRLAIKKIDTDNLGRAMKSIRDQVAAILGIDDALDCAHWDCQQEPGHRTKAVRIEVWGS